MNIGFSVLNNSIRLANEIITYVYAYWSVTQNEITTCMVSVCESQWTLCRDDADMSLLLMLPEAPHNCSHSEHHSTDGL